MCGIAGWFDTQGDRPADRSLIKSMADSIRHRGPDGEGFHFEPGLALAHRRLAIIDLNTGQQPMFSSDEQIVIVFNGEIYNYRELQQQLEGRGYKFVTCSDTEVIINAWKAWGSRCVEYLQGMFAFALWDRQKKTLFLARDRLGEKPLYYSLLRDGSLIFGSELKALLVDPRLERKIDPCAVQDFFSLGYVADPKTIYQGVKKLAAGHCLIIEKGRAPRENQFWDAVPIEFSSGDLNSVADELRDRLQSSVKAQLIADVPVGSFLSGGVDSSAITAMAALQVAGALNAFTIGFDDPRFDERQYANSVAQRYGVRQYSEVASADDFGIVSKIPGIFDEPFGDSSALPTLILAELASRTVKVALSGDGGDELFAGYRRYFFHNREERVRGLLPAGARRAVFGTLGRIYPQFDWLPRPFRARQTFRELSCDAAEGYFHNVSILNEDVCASLFSSALRNDVAGYRTVDIFSNLMKNAPSDDPITVAQYVDIKTWLVGDILTKVDRTAMSVGLEVRVPMLDGDFVRWSLGLPKLFKLSGDTGKLILKRALEPLLPKNILYRQKQGFSIPLSRWFKGPFGEAFEQELDTRGQLEQFIDVRAARQLLQQHRNGWADNSRALWLLWMFNGFLTQTHNSSS
jgi:asparagine synthase (glutamine-hydrolysing)